MQKNSLGFSLCHVNTATDSPANRPGIGYKQAITRTGYIGKSNMLARLDGEKDNQDNDRSLSNGFANSESHNNQSPGKNNKAAK